MVTWPALQRPIHIARRVWTGFQWLFLSPHRNKFLVYHGPSTLGKRTTIFQLACILVQKKKVPGGVCFVRCGQPKSMKEFLEILVQHLRELNLHPDVIKDLKATESSLQKFFHAIEKDFALFIIPDSPLDDWFPTNDNDLLAKICSFLERISRLNNLYVCTSATQPVWKSIAHTNLYHTVSMGIKVGTQSLDEARDFVLAEKSKIPKTLNANTVEIIQLIDKLLESELFSKGDRRIKYQFPRTARTLHGLVSLIVAGVPMHVIEQALMNGLAPQFYAARTALKNAKKLNLFADVKNWMNDIIALRKTLTHYENFA